MNCSHKDIQFKLFNNLKHEEILNAVVDGTWIEFSTDDGLILCLDCGKQLN
jgi:hypothetical protein